MLLRVFWLCWDDFFCVLDMLVLLWLLIGMLLVSVGVVQVVVVFYWMLFIILQQLFIGKEVMVWIGDYDVVLIVIELDLVLELQGLVVGQLGEVWVVVCGISWDQYYLYSVVVVLCNVYICLGVLLLVIVVFVELLFVLLIEIFDDVFC